jgi:hypothetical protein
VHLARHRKLRGIGRQLFKAVAGGADEGGDKGARLLQVGVSENLIEAAEIEDRIFGRAGAVGFGRRPGVEPTRQHAAQGLERDRLAQHVVDAGVAAWPDDRRLVGRRDADDRRVLVAARLVLAHRAGQRQAIHHRHVEVGEN